MKRTLQAVASAVGGRLIGDDRPYATVSIDSRTLSAGALFVALRGPNFDATEFVAAAAARGAVGALVDRHLSAPIDAAALSQVVVDDPLKALQSLAKNWRNEFNIPLVAVAGSNGKTTTKEMIAAILSRRGSCLATLGNLNNHIGVPLTLMRLESSCSSAVIEMGANRRGDVAQLVDFARPTVGLITNAGAEHLEGFGDMRGVAIGEGEMVAGLGSTATAIINADDEYADYWRSVAQASRIVTFGVQSAADFTAINSSLSIEQGEFCTRFTLLCHLGEQSIVIAAGGAHNIANALAAAAAASAAGATLEDIAQGLASFRSVSGRLQLKAGVRGSWLIDDTYNANPSSVRAGIDVMRALKGQTWVVLGDMAELGESANDSHAAMGRYAKQSGVKRLFGFGPLSSNAAEAFGAGAEWFSDIEAMILKLQSELAAGVTVLIKGSRINRLERVVRSLTAIAS